MRKSLLIISAITTLVALGYWQMVKNPRGGIVQAVGQVTATFPSQPLFMVSNWLPGDSVSKTFSVHNGGSEIFNLAVRTEHEVSNPAMPDLASVTQVVISDNENVVWYGTGSAGGARNLANWYIQPYIMLGNIDPGETKVFTVRLAFLAGSENEYQLTQTQFDIVLMKELAGPNGEQVPDECKQIEFRGEPIVGTNNSEIINGNLGNNLIFGLDGDDFIIGHVGDDCLIGGKGNDRILGGTGKDYVWGNEGDDILDAGSDEDRIWGGDGNDKIDGGSDPDIIFGGNGNDTIDAGSGNDYVYGENGDDKMDGGSGIDYVYGGAGNDDIKGGSSDDFLYGEGGSDKTDGESGTGDKCVAEVKVKCEL